ncbi:MAG: winged helix-turn-helix domain-containing protein, partial [Marinosulfonomonas sp.]|nr:winged helix-turn-helix domain-containing protein [Marinosulfonomonas sp.]
MIYRFGEYCLDAALYELRAGGNRVAIEPQVFSLLQYLIENRDRVVSKDDMIGAVWGGRAISESTLSSRIFAMRRAIGDTGQTQALIRTVPRRGLRFIGKVVLEEKKPPTANEPAPPNAEILSSGEASADAAIPAIPAGPIRNSATVLPTLAVLPFKNASADLDEYFCDGLTEDIISNLTHFSEIRVIASGSSFQFKERALSLADIAGKLNADYIVDGSVRCDKTRLRIAVQLVDATTGVSIWADRYDREMEDIFAVQDAVTHMVVASLGVKMQDA